MMMIVVVVVVAMMTGKRWRAHGALVRLDDGSGGGVCCSGSGPGRLVVVDVARLTGALVHHCLLWLVDPDEVVSYSRHKIRWKRAR